jgi:hypothetical protein
MLALGLDPWVLTGDLYHSGKGRELLGMIVTAARDAYY